MKELVIIKIKTFIKLMVVFTFGILMAILMRLLYPFIHIRVGILPSDRLGNWADVSMYFFCSQALDLNKKKIDFFFLEETQPTNNFFLKLIKRELKINRFVQFIYTANSYLPRSSLFYNVNEATLYGDWQKYSRDTAPCPAAQIEGHAGRGGAAPARDPQYLGDTLSLWEGIDSHPN